MIKKISFVLLLSVFTLSVPSSLSAQDFEFGDPDVGGEEPPVEVPFDSGVCLLIASAVLYGLKKDRDKRKAIKLDGVQ